MSEAARVKHRTSSRARSKVHGAVMPDRNFADGLNSPARVSTWIDLTAYEVPSEEREQTVSTRADCERRTPRDDTQDSCKNDELGRDSPINWIKSDAAPIRVWHSDQIEKKDRNKITSPGNISGPIRIWESERPRPEHPPLSKYHKALERLEMVRRRTSERSAAFAKDTDILTDKHEKLVQKSLEYRKNSALNEIIHVENEPTPTLLKSPRHSRRLFIDTSAMEEVLEDKTSPRETIKDFMSAFSYEFKKTDLDEQSDVIFIDDILPRVGAKRETMKSAMNQTRKQDASQKTTQLESSSPSPRRSNAPSVMSLPSPTIAPSSEGRKKNRVGQLQQEIKIRDIHSSGKSPQQKKSAKARGLPIKVDSSAGGRGLQADAESDYVDLTSNASSPKPKNQDHSIDSGQNMVDREKLVHSETHKQRDDDQPNANKELLVDAEAGYRDIQASIKLGNSVDGAVLLSKTQKSLENIGRNEKLVIAERDFLAIRKKKYAAIPTDESSKLSSEQMGGSSTKPIPVANVDTFLTERPATPQHSLSRRKNVHDRLTTKEKLIGTVASRVSLTSSSTNLDQVTNPTDDGSKLLVEQMGGSSVTPIPIAKVGTFFQERPVSPQHSLSRQNNILERLAKNEKVTGNDACRVSITSSLANLDQGTENLSGTDASLIHVSTGADVDAVTEAVVKGSSDYGFPNRSVLVEYDGCVLKSASKEHPREVSLPDKKLDDGSLLVTRSEVDGLDPQHIDVTAERDEPLEDINLGTVADSSNEEIETKQLLETDEELDAKVNDIRPDYIDDFALSADKSSSSRPSDAEEEDDEVGSEPTFKTGNKAQANSNDQVCDNAASLEVQQQLTETVQFIKDINGGEPSGTSYPLGQVVTDSRSKKDTEVSISEDNISCGTDNSEAKLSIVDSETTDSEMDEEPEIYDTCAGVPFAIQLLDVTCAWLEREEYCVQPSLLKKVKRREPEALNKFKRGDSKQPYVRPPRMIARVPRSTTLSRCFGNSRRQTTEKRFTRSKEKADSLSSRSDCKISHLAHPQTNRGRGELTECDKKGSRDSPREEHARSGEACFEAAVTGLQGVVTPISSNVSKQTISDASCALQKAEVAESEPELIPKVFKQTTTEASCALEKIKAAETEPEMTLKANTGKTNQVDALDILLASSDEQRSDVSSVQVNFFESESMSGGIFVVKSAEEYSSRRMSYFHRRSHRARSLSPRTQRLGQKQKVSFLTSCRVSKTSVDCSPTGFSDQTSPYGIRSEQPGADSSPPDINTTMNFRRTTGHQNYTQIPIDCTEIASSHSLEQTLYEQCEAENTYLPYSVSAGIGTGSAGRPEALLRPRNGRDGSAEFRNGMAPAELYEDETPADMISPSHLSTLNDGQRLAAIDLAEKLRRRATTLKRRRKIRERRKELRNLVTLTATSINNESGRNTINLE